MAIRPCSILLATAWGGIGGDNWLIPVDDGDIQVQDDVRDYSVGVNVVLRRLEGRGKGVNILILDACRNNPLPSRARGGKSTRGLARMEAPSGSFITYAAAPGKVADDGAGSNGLFTQELLERLGKSPGQSIDDLMTDVAKAVRAKSGGKQAPHRESSLEQRFYFTPSTGSPSPNPNPRPDSGPSDSGSGEMLFWQSVEKRGDIADYQLYLRKYPDGHFADLAKSSIARLKKTPVVASVGKPVARPVVAPVVDKDTIFWQSIRNSKDPADYGAYLESYPGGGFAALARKRFASLQRAKTERRRREEAPRRKELMELERKDPQGFWKDVTRRDAELLVSDTRPGSWPAFTTDWGEGQSRLHIAAVNGNDDVVRVLLERGADINARTSTQRTPLHIAVEKWHDEVVRMLLERGADVNARNMWQATPLHIAAFHGDDEVARMLLERGADINARTKDGETALDWANREGHTGVGELLRAKLRQAGRR